MKENEFSNKMKIIRILSIYIFIYKNLYFFIETYFDFALNQ
jgi:hypothetical protein